VNVIDVWRMSASRPWQLAGTHNDLIKHLQYSGKLRFHLIESVVEKKGSAECIQFAERNGYEVHVIDPAKGQGCAMEYAVRHVISSEFALKWEDDFRPVMPIPLDNCISAMWKYTHINQICFNKRKTLSWKWTAASDGTKYQWPKKQRYFDVADVAGQTVSVPMVVKEKWWFGSALWRMAYIKPLFRAFENNTHNYMNDRVLLPLISGFSMPDGNGKGAQYPTPEEIEKYIGCYIYGKTGDPPMVEHTGRGDSLWMGEMQKKWTAEGKEFYSGGR